jgi:hypothetical protein
MTARAAFRQDDIARLVKGAIAGGLRVGGVEVSLDGRKITVLSSDAAAGGAHGPNPLDRLLGEEDSPTP